MEECLYLHLALHMESKLTSHENIDGLFDGISLGQGYGI